ncbi:MAG: hypothetical protein SAK29_14365 [Scytonema sp. PMC 1069.18]|nr:hypothetical protein [Scytonema sp. PMC 1069.18]MEC4880795.1 hypothetical protein [Scytonema sp. PMC 1070.18]
MPFTNRKFQPKYRYIATIQENPPTPETKKDPLIAKGLQIEQYIGIFGLGVALIAAIGILSRRVEYAILFAIVLSIILIGFFLTI